MESLKICSKQKLKPFDFEGLLGLLAAYYLEEEVVEINAFKGWGAARIPRKDIVKLKGKHSVSSSQFVRLHF